MAAVGLVRVENHGTSPEIVLLNLVRRVLLASVPYASGDGKSLMEPSLAAADVVVLDDVLKSGCTGWNRTFPVARYAGCGRPGTVRSGSRRNTDSPTGSFKIRGALFAMLKLHDARALPGVVATSSGNH